MRGHLLNTVTDKNFQIALIEEAVGQKNRLTTGRGEAVVALMLHDADHLEPFRLLPAAADEESLPHGRLARERRGGETHR